MWAWKNKIKNITYFLKIEKRRAHKSQVFLDEPELREKSFWRCHPSHTSPGPRDQVRPDPRQRAQHRALYRPHGARLNFICPQKAAQHSRGWGGTKNHLTSEPDLAGGSPPGVSSGFYLKDHLSNVANLPGRFPLFLNRAFHVKCISLK